ncbi:MAG: hypothetical protein RJA87_1291 [Pseudomonadota bacterium]|jgi:glucose/arabinose dehydrogenase
MLFHPKLIKQLHCLAWAVILCISGSPTVAQETVLKTERYRVKVETVASGLVSPWSVAFLPDGLTLITEKSGHLRVMQAGRLLTRPVSGLPKVTALGQGGLLDVIAHPAFRQNRLIYWSYTAGTAEAVGTEVARGRLSCRGDDCRLDEVEVIFVQQPKVKTGRHFGSRLIWDRDGNLFVTLGDRGLQDEAQNLGNHLGTVVRITATGATPADNPFTNRNGVKSEIFTYGNRNVQGAAIHPSTGDLWAHEHGPQGGDELNILKSGRNYGWPVITNGRTYGLGATIGEGTERSDIPKALKIWLPQSIAPSGLTFYTGRLFGEWQTSLFLGSLREQRLIRLTLKGNVVNGEESIGGFGRVRDVREGPDGALYVLSDSMGKLFRLTPAK